MQKYVIIGGLVVIGVLIFLLFSGENTPLLGVNEVGADPGAYTGTIAVTGIAAGYSRNDPAVFGLMDIKELQCQSANCNKIMLPVKYAGAMPQIGDEVEISGAFTQVQGGYLFTAEAMKVVRNHKLGS